MGVIGEIALGLVAAWVIIKVLMFFPSAFLAVSRFLDRIGLGD